MNVLIGGGFGFIGSYLTPWFLEHGAAVGVLARRVPPSFEDLARRVECHIHHLGADSPPQLGKQYDYFINLAGALHSATGNSDAIARAVDVTRRGLELCRRHGIPRFVHFSTFQVYGRDHGFVDERTPVSCLNDYACAHYLAEEEVRHAGGAEQVEYVIVRPTNCYGFSAHTDVQRWTLVPGCFCRSAVEQQAIVLRTSGHQQKDFIHLEQVAALTHQMCVSFGRFRNSVVNLAGGTSHAIIDVAALVKEAYERMSHRSCALQVLSDSPQPAEPLVVSRAKTADLPYAPSAERTLTADVNHTLAFLNS